MIKKRNAQAAFDNMALLGLVLLVSIAVFYYASEASNTNSIYLTDTVRSVENTVESLSNLGDGSADTIVIRTPKGVDTAILDDCGFYDDLCKTMEVTMDTGEVHRFGLSYPVWGSLGFFFIPGTHYVTMVNDGDNQRIVFQECGDGLVTGSEQCEACKTIEDCDAQYSSNGVNCEIPLGEEWGYCTYDGNGGCLNGNTCREPADPEGFGCYCECTTDDDCPSGTCLPDGNGGKVCGGCENDNDCDNGEYCSLGNCLDCDRDGDGVEGYQCGGPDCDDDNINIYPDEALEDPLVGDSCYDTYDNDCDGSIDCADSVCDADPILCPGNGGGSCDTNLDCGATGISCYQPCINPSGTGGSCDACTSDLDCDFGDACNIVSGECCSGFSCEKIASYSLNNIYIDPDRNDWSIADDEVEHTSGVNEPYYDLRVVIDRDLGFNSSDTFERGALWLAGGKMKYGLQLIHEGHSSDGNGAAVGYAYEVEPALGGDYLADALADNSFSFEFWFNSNGLWCSDSGQCPQQLIAGLYDQDLDQGLIVYLSQNVALSEQYIAVRLKDGINTELYYLDNNNVNDGSWHQFVMVRDVESGEDRIYLDANLLTTTTPSSFINLATLNPKPIFQISGGHNNSAYQHSDYDNFYSGWIDGISFYTTAIDNDPNAVGNLNAAAVGNREDYCNPPPSDPYCGDGIINQFSEECDPPDFDGKTCNDFGGRWGDLECTNNCKFDISGCWNSECSDSRDNDGDNLIDFGPYPQLNDPGCSSPMDRDESNIEDNYCGDGIIDLGEECEAGVACPPGFFCAANTCSCYELPKLESPGLGAGPNLPPFDNRGLPFSCPPPGTCKAGSVCAMIGLPMDNDGDGWCDAGSCAMTAIICDDLCGCPDSEIGCEWPPYCGNDVVDPGEDCEPPGSQCDPGSGSSGSGTCQSDCSCLDNCVGPECSSESWWESLSGWFS
ncbi:hypothetical protein HOB91_03270 [Candidatus Woesearchaeota archaeon]|nr:hypothetical protein [Candidatus Woesearchaeota archaeon]